MNAPSESPAAVKPAEAAQPATRGVVGGLRHFARRSPLSAFWGCIALLIVVMAVAAPVISPYPPLKSDFSSMQKAPYEEHLFGTDQIGRDTLSRVIHGSRTSLIV
ncbi:MAG: ABC transporter permease, partial [Alphaproteobacteria bacterium]|nr:ABC transporter permease [Alphaproteobacteria bacterium]